MKWQATGTPGHYCQKVSPGCEWCYAGRLQFRWHGEDYPDVSTDALQWAQAMVQAGTIYLDHKFLAQPRTWARPRLIFPCSMTDLFAEWVPFDWLVQIWTVMQANQRHRFQVLTKRPKRLQQFASMYPRLFDPPLPNVWLGVTVEHGGYVWRAKDLLRVPAAVRWVSAEPLSSGMDDLSVVIYDLDWLVAGGLSGGPKEMRLVRPCQEHLHLSLSDTCAHCDNTGYRPTSYGLRWATGLQQMAEQAHVPFVWKQWGGPTAKAGGRKLCGRIYDQYPDGHGGITDKPGAQGHSLPSPQQPALI